jgi:hypothetical protein
MLLTSRDIPSAKAASRRWVHIVKPDAERKPQICDEWVNARTEKAVALFRNIMFAIAIRNGAMALLHDAISIASGSNRRRDK